LCAGPLVLQGFGNFGNFGKTVTRGKFGKTVTRGKFGKTVTRGKFGKVGKFGKFGKVGKFGIEKYLLYIKYRPSKFSTFFTIYSEKN